MRDIYYTCEVCGFSGMTHGAYVGHTPEACIKHLLRRVAELEELIIEADAHFNTNKQPADFEAASLALVRMCSMGSEALDKFFALEQENAELKEAAEWHPVSEPPDTRRYVLGYNPEYGGLYGVAYYDKETAAWYGGLLNITHWRELPEPPAE